MKTRRFLILVPVGILAMGCLPDDEERCSGDYSWNPKTIGCDLEKESNGVTPPPSDAGDASPGETITGMGEVCFDSADCAGYEADICSVSPLSTDGYCTVAECSNEPDNCPPGYRCCVFINLDSLPVEVTMDMSSLCLTPDYYDQASNVGVCDE